MKRNSLITCLFFAATMWLFAAHPIEARAEQPLQAEAILIWGTDNAQSPNPKHIPVDDALAAKLLKSPYRWKYYFEVNRQKLEIPVGTTTKGIIMSKHCVLDVANLGSERIEVKLFGDNKYVSDHKETFGDKCTLVIAGPAENQTAWMVVLRKIKPAK